MKHWTKALGALAAAAAAYAGCDPVALDPVQSATMGGTSESAATGLIGGSGSATESTESGATVTVMAMLLKDVPGPSQSNGVPWIEQGADPDTLVLFFANEPQLCIEPELGGNCPDPTVWQSALLVPSDLVHVGLVDLGHPRIVQWWWQYQSTDGSGSCNISLGTVGHPVGTLEILSLDATTVSVKLSGGVSTDTPGQIEPPPPHVLLAGSYALPRCDAAAPVQPPHAAVAIPGSSLPSGLSSNPTVGASPDPTALYVFLGAGTGSCSNPTPALACDGAGRVTFKIPANVQHPGMLDITDPGLAASIEIAANDGASTCTTSVGTTFTAGTLDLQSIDASTISFTLFKTLGTAASGAGFDADGLYQATICP